MTILADGTVVQDGLRVTPRRPSSAPGLNYLPYPVIGQITKVAFIDSDDNGPGETCLCDIHIQELGIDFFQVPWTLPKAGPDNYVHYGPVAASKNLDLSPFNAQLLKPKVSDGDTVIVVCAYGDPQKPYILRVIPHNQSGVDGMSPDPRPGEADGDCYKVRFNGTYLLIDKDGNLTIKNTDALDKLTPRAKVLTIDWNKADGDGHVVTIDMTSGSEVVQIEHSTGSTVLMDPDGAVTVQSKDGDKVLVSPTEGVQVSAQAGGNATASFKDGNIDIVADNNITLTASGGNYTIDAAGGDLVLKSSAGAVTVEADGGDVNVKSTTGNVKLTDSAGATLKLATGKVALGTSAAEIVDLFSKTLAKLNSAFTDLSTTTAPGFGAPISSVAQFAALAADIVAIKALADAIKGSV